MAEFSANQQQVVNLGETVIFTETPVPCRRGLIRHRDDTGNFLLVGFVPRRRICPCQRQNDAQYLIDFGATIPANTMTVTPAAVEQFFYVSRAINAAVVVLTADI